MRFACAAGGQQEEPELKNRNTRTANGSAQTIGYRQTNLASSVPNVANNVTPGLANPWGLLPKELSLIGDALDQVAKVEPELAELVDLKFFCGFTFSEIAALRNLSERTVIRSWEKARIYLHRSIRADLPL
jgi:hypothetical protein